MGEPNVASPNVRFPPKAGAMANVLFRPIADIRIGDDAVIMNRFGTLAYALAVAGIVLITARETIEPSAYLYEHSSGMVALGVAGWFVATLGPLALSAWFWRLARWKGRQWVWHLLFIPCAFATFRTGASTLYYAAGVPDGDSIEGYTLFAAFGLLMLTLLVHSGALIAQCVLAVMRTAKVR